MPSVFSVKDLIGVIKYHKLYGRGADVDPGTVFFIDDSSCAYKKKPPAYVQKR